MPVLVMDIRSMWVFMYLVGMGMQMGVMPTRNRMICSLRMGMVMMRIIVPVPVIMDYRRMPVGMAVIFGEEDYDPDEHEEHCRDEDQAGKLLEKQEPDDDPEYRVDSEV